MPLHLSKCSTCNAKNIMNTPNIFPVMKKRYASLCGFEHIKLSNLIGHKATNNKQNL